MDQRSQQILHFDSVEATLTTFLFSINDASLLRWDRKINWVQNKFFLLKIFLNDVLKFLGIFFKLD